jgi:hypothetical protein
MPRRTDIESFSRVAARAAETPHCHFFEEFSNVMAESR